MTDDETMQGLDRRLIALDEPYEVRDWCRSFGCSKEELKNAVKSVGNSADRVREYLRSGDSRA